MTATATRFGWFDTALSPIVDPAIGTFHDELAAEPGLAEAERDLLAEALSVVFSNTIGRLTSRVLLLELNAARMTGLLQARDSAARWHEFVEGCADPAWWDRIGEHYPTLLPRLRTVAGSRVCAALTMVRRLLADRHLLPAGELTEVTIGSGDSHGGGHTVNILRLGDTNVVYKPRSLAVDATLAAFLARVGETFPELGARVPAVHDRGGYGWAEFVPHRHCEGADELRRFYIGTGHWLALMRLFGGTDLHGENVIACGPYPYMIDCETLMAPAVPQPPTGFGLANDRAGELIVSSVLRIGLLPTRGMALGWRGVDMSAVGGLPGEQPTKPMPIIIDAGLDTARLGYRPMLVEQPTTNHPGPQPRLHEHWGAVLGGFTELTAQLRELDGAGRLEPALDAFRDCRIRVVARDTETYAEHLRMLWHPASLHNEAVAVERAAALLRTRGGDSPNASGDPAVALAEVQDLLVGDIPIYTTTPRVGQRTAPGGHLSGARENLVSTALARWRTIDLDLEDAIIRASLVGAYLNDGWLPNSAPLQRAPVVTRGLDARRRAVAAALLRRLVHEAFRGEDGTATWIAPVLDPTGWQVQTSSTEIYGGLHGLAVTLAGYRAEVAAGRADAVPDAGDLLDAVVRSMGLAEDAQERDRGGDVPRRPPPPGGFIGIGAQLWAWLVLDRLAVGGHDATARAIALGELMPAAIDADDLLDVLGGIAGAVVPLLHLAEHTGDDRWVELAARAGDRLAAAAVCDGDTARWPTRRWPQGIGGFSHGSTGIGWALARLSLVTGEHAELAAAAFAHEETLFDPERGSWLDARETEPLTGQAWCHGAGGVGVVAADLLRRTGDERHLDVLRRAVAAVWTKGLGFNHTLCHGDLGCWEVLAAALEFGVAPPEVDRERLAAQIVGSIERHGPVCGLANDAFTPGLLPGVGGMPYQLLRMDPACRLPSVLVLDLPARP